jgi:hypothetical protein
MPRTREGAGAGPLALGTTKRNKKKGGKPKSGGKVEWDAKRAPTATNALAHFCRVAAAGAACLAGPSRNRRPYFAGQDVSGLRIKKHASRACESAMHIVRIGLPKSRILMGTAGLFLAACGIAAVLDYIIPGWFWLAFIVLAVVLLGLFGKVVYDGHS